MFVVGGVEGQIGGRVGILMREEGVVGTGRVGWERRLVVVVFDRMVRCSGVAGTLLGMEDEIA